MKTLALSRKIYVLNLSAWLGKDGYHLLRKLRE